MARDFGSIITPTAEQQNQALGASSTGYKEVLDLLKSADILPSEFDAITNNVMAMFSDIDMEDTSAPIKIYLQTLQQIQHAKLSKQQYSDANKHLQSINGYDDYAITKDGQLVAIDGDGKVYTTNKPDGNRILTNAELLELRASNSNYRFQDSLFNVATNAASYDSVHKKLIDVFKKLGSDNTTNKTVSAGLMALQEAQEKAVEGDDDEEEGASQSDLTVPGLMSHNLISKSQARQINYALSYLWKTLDGQTKTWLKLHSDGTDEGALQLMSTIAYAHTSSTTSEQEGFNKWSGKTGAGNDNGAGSGLLALMDPKQKMNSAMIWLTMIDNDPTCTEFFQFNPGGKYGVNVQAAFGTVMDGSKALGEATMDEVSHSQFAGILDLDKATMAGQRIANPDEVVANWNKLYSVYLPVDQNGNPDFQQLQTLSQADTYFTQNDITDPKEKNRILQEQFNLPPKYDETTGEVMVGGPYKRFAMIQATAAESAFEDDEIKDIFKQQGALVEEIANKSNKFGEFKRVVNHNRPKDEKKEYDEDDWGYIEGPYTHLYEGLVFIPVNRSYQLAAAGGNTQLKEGHAMNVAAASQYSYAQNAAASKQRRQITTGNQLQK